MITEPSTYVTLISSDGFEFIVRRDCAYHSKTIKTMLDPTSKFQILRPLSGGAKKKRKDRGLSDMFGVGNFSEASSGRCTFPDIR